MKSSQTWNQGFEDMRLDSHHTERHPVSEELSNREAVDQSLSDTLELPPESTYQPPHTRPTPYPHPQRNDPPEPRPPANVQYSPTDPNHPISGQPQNHHLADQRTPRLLEQPHNPSCPPAPTTPPKQHRNLAQPTPIAPLLTSPLQPHYPPSSHIAHIAVVRQPVPSQPQVFKSLDALRNPIQQSLAPQKALIVGQLASTQTGHASQSRLQSQKPGMRHSLIQERRVNSPNTRINFDYGSPREGVVARNAMFNSYIPPSQVIPERAGASSTNGPLLSERHHHEAFGEAAHWKEKYEEASRRWEMAKMKEGREVEVLGGKFRALEQNYAQLQVAYEQLLAQYHAKLDENQRYFQQVQQLQHALNRPPPDSDKINRLLRQREEQISKLVNKVEQLSNARCEHEVSIMSQTTKNGTSDLPAMQTALQQKTMLIAYLKAENQQLQTRLQDLALKYEQEMQNMNEQGVMLMELEQQNTLLQSEREQREQDHNRELDNTRSLQENTRSAQDNPRHLAAPTMKRSDNSQMLLERSRMESFDNNSRIMQLEMHIGKLNSELNLRDEAYEHELKMANMKIAELIDRLKAVANEKDQVIRTLQEKAGLLESDLNKKDSIVRNLKDQLALMDHKRSPVREVNVYSSAVNAMDHRVGEIPEQFRRQLDNLRKNLFQRQREKLSLRQKLEQLEQKLHESEQSLSKKKIENQNIRRQLNEYDNLQHENEKLLEVLSKKNGDLMEMREMLLEKEQHTGEYEILSKENEKLRDIMVKKNEELSEMADKLYNEEKRTRELAAAHDLNEEIERLQDLLARKDTEINKYYQSLQLAQSNYSDIEFELQRQKNVNEQYEAVIRSNRSRLQDYEDEFNKLELINQKYEQEICRMAHELEDMARELSDRSTNEQHARNQLESATRELEEKLLQLEEHARESHQLRLFKERSTKEIESIESRQAEAFRQHQQLTNKCRQLQTALKQRDQKLYKTQKELEQTKEKYRKHHDCDKQIEVLTEKVSDYEMKVLRLNMNRSFGTNYQQVENSHVFENQVIYQLKRENEFLKQQHPHQKMQHLHPNSQNLLEDSHQSPVVEGAVKTRLDEFHQKLHSTIHRVTSQTDLHRHTSTKTLPERNQQALLQQQNREIQRLKTLAQQMQKEQLMKTEREGSSGSSSKHITPEYIEMVYQQELNFYKSKNDQLEERINSHIKVNRDLKFTLDNLLRNKDNSHKQFYENELKRVNEVNAQLEKQNKQLKHEVKRAHSNSSSNQNNPNTQNHASELQMMAMKGRDVDGPYRFTLKTHFDNWQEPMQ